MADDAASTQPQTVYEKWNSDTRATAKWLLTVFGAIGAALVAGIQLSSIGKLAADTPGWRLAAAVVGIALALAGILVAVWMTSAVLVPSLDSFRTADKHRDVIHDVLGDKELIDMTYSELKHHFLEARREYDDERTTPERRTALLSDLTDLADLRRRALSAIGSELLRIRFERARRAVMVGVVLAGVGMTLFAWGANAPAGTTSEPVALGTPPSLVRVVFTQQAVAALASARGCRTDVTDALRIAGSDAQPELVTVPTRACKALRFQFTDSVGWLTSAR